MQPEAFPGLVAKASAGDPEAWARLCPAVAGWVTAVAAGLGLAREDVADVNQIVCLRLVSHVGRLRVAEALRGWVVTVARHESYRVLRERQRRAVELDLTGDPAMDLADRWAPAVDERLLRKERQRELHAAFVQLSTDCQRLLRLLATDPPLSYADTALALDRPVGAIGPTRQRCLARLREILDAGAAEAGCDEPAGCHKPAGAAGGRSARRAGSTRDGRR
jgi:RNA polymerase sigma factor (sigma-70 family)